MNVSRAFYFLTQLCFFFFFFWLCFFSTLMCILALFSKLSVVCLVLSGPKGTSFFNCSKYSRSLARLQTYKHRVSQQTSTSRKVRRHLHKQTDESSSTRPWKAETNTVPPALRLSCSFTKAVRTATEYYMTRVDALQVLLSDVTLGLTVRCCTFKRVWGGWDVFKLTEAPANHFQTSVGNHILVQKIVHVRLFTNTVKLLPT